MIPEVSSSCVLLEVVLLYPRTVETVLSVLCYEQQAAFCLHDIISGQNGGRGKTERQRIVRFQARTQGFEKGGYIVKKFPLNFWHFNVELFFSHDRCKNKQFHREHGAHYYEMGGSYETNEPPLRTGLVLAFIIKLYARCFLVY